MLLCLLLAISLSVDAFSTGIAYGLRQIQFPLLSRFCIALETFLLLTLFLLAGSFFATLFPVHLAEYIATLFLFCFGLWLCLQCCIKPKESKTDFLSFLQQPSRCDKNHSAILEPKEALLLGFVLSADACGVGISVSVGGFSVFFLPFFASVTQILFLSLGTFCGNHLQGATKCKEEYATLFSGSILICIALFRFFSIL